jgi:hypothetical protein
LARRAERELQSGDVQSAIQHSRAALAVDGNCLYAHCVLAYIALEGDDYQTMLRKVHEHLRPRAYLEIGVHAGATLRLASPETIAIGVDPAPQVTDPLPAHARVIQATSDEFFARYDLAKEFGGRPIELAFIDGSHLFENVLRDFMNVERHATPASTVLLHDCYPLDEITARREAVTTFSTGDAWKVILCLKKYRPDLKIHTLACPPTGITVIRGLDPASGVLESRLQALYDEFVALPFSVLEDKPAALNLVPGDWSTANALLA